MLMSFLTTPCLAAGLDWLEGLLPVLFVGFWILSQVFALFRKVAKNGGPPQPKPQVVRERPPRPDPEADFGGALNRETIERQIEEFVLGRNGGQSPAPQPVKPAARPVKMRRSEAQRPQPSQPQSRPPVPPLAPHTPATAQAARAERFDTDVARHVHDAFAHDLAHREPALEAAATTPTANREASAAALAPRLAELLRSPGTIRQVIMLREVLERPTDRWGQ